MRYEPLRYRVIVALEESWGEMTEIGWETSQDIRAGVYADDPDEQAAVQASLTRLYVASMSLWDVIDWLQRQPS